jgi:ATP-binding cassette subfamily B protein
LGGMSFTLPAGNTLCVMGPSGCGKTTLAKLACRIYDPTDGTVRFDRTDIRRFKIVDFRKLCGFVTQEPVIFDGTIADNIQYGSQQTDTMGIVAAAQYAQIHEFIVRLPSQYNTLTRERGLTLSGGQKQRVNLARTLLYDPKVLVLDDCTAALDAETEARLIRGFDTVLSGRTVILVSHRLSIAVRCDFVLMLDAGRVTEFGPPGELLRRDGRFAQLQKVQSDENRVLTLQAD